MFFILVVCRGVGWLARKIGQPQVVGEMVAGIMLLRNRKAYLAAVSADIKSEVNAVVKAWSASGGNYIATFLSGKGTSVSSSLGLLLNSLIQDFELTKNDRLGIPLGKLPPATPAH